MKTRIPINGLVAGNKYMASRHYNSKRCIMEPCELLGTQGVNSAGRTLYRIKFLLDGDVRIYQWSFYEFDPKWLERKIISLDKERAETNRQIDNLALALA